MFRPVIARSVKGRLPIWPRGTCRLRCWKVVKAQAGQQLCQRAAIYDQPTGTAQFHVRRFAQGLGGDIAAQRNSAASCSSRARSSSVRRIENGTCRGAQFGHGYTETGYTRPSRHHWGIAWLRLDDLKKGQITGRWEQGSYQPAHVSSRVASEIVGSTYARISAPSSATISHAALTPSTPPHAIDRF